MSAFLNIETLTVVLGAAVIILGYFSKKTSNKIDDKIYKIATSIKDVVDSIQSPEDTAKVLTEKEVSKKIAEVEATISDKVKKAADDVG